MIKKIDIVCISIITISFLSLLINSALVAANQPNEIIRTEIVKQLPQIKAKVYEKSLNQEVITTELKVASDELAKAIEDLTESIKRLTETFAKAEEIINEN